MVEDGRLDSVGDEGFAGSGENGGEGEGRDRSEGGTRVCVVTVSSLDRSGGWELRLELCPSSGGVIEIYHVMLHNAHFLKDLGQGEKAVWLVWKLASMASHICIILCVSVISIDD